MTTEQSVVSSAHSVFLMSGDATLFLPPIFPPCKT